MIGSPVRFRVRWALVLAAGLQGCSGGDNESLRSASSAAVTDTSSVPTASTSLEYAGMCEASAAAVSADRFAVADDEVNVLRVYGTDPTVGVTDSVDLWPYLRLTETRNRGADIEAAAALGDTVYWIGSHSRNSEGELRRIRHRIFATVLHSDRQHGMVEPVGVPYSNFLDDLIADARYARFGIAEAEKLSAESGGVNMEGLVATPQGELLIGFRSPVVNGRALVARIQNPRQVIAGGRATLGDPVELDLGGLGIRSMEFIPETGGYFIVAGSADGSRVFRLYSWNGAGAPSVISSISLGGIWPEAAIRLSGASKDLLLLSDDGDLQTAGVACPDLDGARQRFRALRVSLPIGGPP